jgi:hypothetical protein
VAKAIIHDATASFEKGKTNKMKTQDESQAAANRRENGYPINDSCNPPGASGGRPEFFDTQRMRDSSPQNWGRTLDQLRRQIKRGFGMDRVLKDHFC